MRAAVVALVAALLCVVAITVDAYTYRIYRGSSDCTLGSGKSVRYYFGSIGQCLRYNSTSTNNYAYAKVTKCNATSGKYKTERYGANSGCTGDAQDDDFDINKCYEYSPSTTPVSSFRITCSAGSVAFTAIVAILVFVAFLF